MNTLERNWLLMEQEGFDTTKACVPLSEALFHSPLYKISLEKLERASSCGRTSVLQAYHELRDLNFSVASILNYALLETKVLNLALKSAPEWWVNPFDFNETKLSVTTIGDLFAKDDCSMTFNQLLNNKEISDIEKKEIVKERVHQYRVDMSTKFDNVMDSIKGKGENSNRFFTFSKIAYVLLLNLFWIFLFMIPSYDYMNSFYHPSVDSLETWMLYLPSFTIPVADLFYFLDTLIQIRLNKNSSYLRHYQRLRETHYLALLDKCSLELMKRLFIAIDVQDTSFSIPISYYADKLNEELNLNRVVLKNKNADRFSLSVLHSLSLFSLGITLLVLIFDIISIVLLKG